MLEQRNNNSNHNQTILVVDDDPDDCLLIKDAFEECQLACNLAFVEDGFQLLHYLHQKSPYQKSPRPKLILLDLNMPKRDGREVLVEIKSHQTFRSIPIVILTTSTSQADVVTAYRNGAASYLIKPDNFESLINLVQQLKAYWFECVKLPEA